MAKTFQCSDKKWVPYDELQWKGAATLKGIWELSTVVYIQTQPSQY
jgi:hypothetical protein